MASPSPSRTPYIYHVDVGKPGGFFLIAIGIMLVLVCLFVCIVYMEDRKRDRCVARRRKAAKNNDEEEQQNINNEVRLRLP